MIFFPRYKKTVRAQKNAWETMRVAIIPTFQESFIMKESRYGRLSYRPIHARDNTMTCGGMHPGYTVQHRTAKTNHVVDSSLLNVLIPTSIESG